LTSEEEEEDKDPESVESAESEGSDVRMKIVEAPVQEDDSPTTIVRLPMKRRRP
jgi:hypothetical protein